MPMTTHSPLRRLLPPPVRIKTWLKRVAVVIGVVVVILLLPVAYLKFGCGGESELPPQRSHEDIHASTREPGTVLSDATYFRNEDQTYLTLPEWYIVYSADEQASFLQNHGPSAFPYAAATRQYWQTHCHVYRLTGRYPFNRGYHVALYVLGISFSAEYGLKGLYEHTVGAMTSWIDGSDTQEDRYAAAVAKEYADFIHASPFYNLPFGAKLVGLWRQMDWSGPKILRKWERKFLLTAEYGIKGTYSWMVRRATRAAYAPEEEMMYLTVDRLPPALPQREPRIRVLAESGGSGRIIGIPRYEPFREIVSAFADEGILIQDIAGNDDILVTLLSGRSWMYDLSYGQFLFSMDILTRPDRKRSAVRVPVSSLHLFLPALTARGVTLEHLYDY